MDERFTIYTLDKSRSLSLSTRGILGTEPTGLGNKFNVSKKETTTSVYMANKKPDFEPIKLKIYFNADGSSGYANYKRLAEFLMVCGKGLFIFENFDGITKKFANVTIENMPKSEIDENGVFAEDFIFPRFSYWYEEVNESFSIKSVNGNLIGFPQGFPIGFRGKKFTNKFTTVNNFYDDAPILITVSGKIAQKIAITIKDITSGQTVGEIRLSTNSIEGRKIIINAATNKITVDNGGIITNGYGLTDKTKQSFLFLPRGEYEISGSITDADDGEINLSIQRFLLD